MRYVILNERKSLLGYPIRLCVNISSSSDKLYYLYVPFKDGFWLSPLSDYETALSLFYELCV